MTELAAVDDTREFGRRLPSGGEWAARLEKLSPGAGDEAARLETL